MPEESEPSPGELFTQARARRASISGGWRSTSTRASVATPAWSPARARTTSRSWARTKSRGAARCTGSASTAISPVRSPTPGWSISRWRASIARTPRARWFVRSMRRYTATKGSTSRSTAVALARGIAPTTAPTRCGGSITSTTTSVRSSSCGLAPWPRRGWPSRSRCRRTPT